MTGSDHAPETPILERPLRGPTGSGRLVRMAAPHVSPEQEELVLSVLRSGQLAQGPMVERLEDLCASMAGTNDAVAMSNGTVTLEASLAVLGIGAGDEVITSPITFGATLNAIVRSGATARFADVRPDFTLDPQSVGSLVGPATTAVIPVHLYGLPADMPAIDAVASSHGLAVVEDAAQAHGASVGDRPVGSFGLGSFSFYATKNVTTGEGGVVTTSDPAHARQLRLLRNQGMAEPYRYEMIGANMRMTDLQAALGIPQLERLTEISASRSANAEALHVELRSRVPSVVLPRVPVGRRHAWHLYTVLLPDESNRDHIRRRMRELDVETAINYPKLVWDHPPYRQLAQVVRDETPTAAAMVGRCLSLPIRHGLDSSDLKRVAHALGVALG